MHLRQPRFTYSACGPFNKNKEFKNLKKQEIEDHQDKLDIACFQHDIAYGDFTDLRRRTAADKVLYDEAFNIAKNPKYHGCQRGVASMVYNLFDKKAFNTNSKQELILKTNN